MSLLAEMNKIIKENNEKTLNINGNLVSLQDMEVDHEYHPGQLLFHATHTDPEEWSDDETSALNIHSLTFDIKTRNNSYIVRFDFENDANYHENDKQLLADMKNITPDVLDDDDNEVKDNQIVFGLRNICIQYVDQSDLFDRLYKEGNQKELSRDDGRDYDDSDDYDDLPQYYDGTGRI